MDARVPSRTEAKGLAVPPAQYPSPQHRMFRVAEIRALPLEKRADGSEEEYRDYEVAVSSEYPVRRGYGSWAFDEVLVHTKEAIVMDRFASGRAAVMVEHVSDQVGVIRSARLDSDRVLRAVVRFSKNPYAQTVEKDVADGIRCNVSVGYDPHEWTTEESAEGGVETVRVTKWMPGELSFIAVPADPTVGVNRSADDTTSSVYFERRNSTTMSDKNKNGAAPDDAGTEPTPATTRSANVEVNDQPAAAARQAAQLERTRTKEIFQLATAHGMVDQAGDWMERGLSVSDVKGEILESIRTRGEGQPASERVVELSEKDQKRYSVVRAILMGERMKQGRSIDGLEGEVHQEIFSKLPEKLYRGGILVPTQLRDSETLMRRSLNTKQQGKGAELVFDAQPGDIIELQRAKTRCVQMGATQLTGLQGNVPFPKEINGMTVEWVPETPASDANESDPTWGQVILSPKAMTGAGSYSRQFLAQSPYDIEGIVRNHLAKGHASAFDRTGLHGSGVNGEPLGLYSAPDVQPVTFGGAGWDFQKVLDMVGAVLDQNYDDEGLGFLTTPLMARKARGMLEFSAAGAQTVWTGKMTEGEMAGFVARSTNQVRKDLGVGADEHGMIYGAWGNMVFGMWGVMELIVDQITKARRAEILVTSYQMGDSVILRGNAFAKATGAKIA
jgi:hypothetical protein